LKDVKITTLADNLVQVAGFQGQWGLSFLLEFLDDRSDRRKIIFDTANDPNPFFHNIKKLKLDLSDLDAIVISHGHGDHTSSTVELIEDNGGVKVYAHPHVFQPRFYERADGRRVSSGPPDGEGISDIESAGGEVFLSRESVEIVPGLWTTGEVPRSTPFEVISPPPRGGKRIIIVEDEERPDLILDDQSLWMEVKGIGPFIVTGCAHSGAINIINHVKALGGLTNIWGLIGGTHLVGRTDEYLSKTIEEFSNFDLALLSPCHCTGFKATAKLWGAFPDAFVLNYSGRSIQVGEEIKPKLV
jgi:7,8-dihydropterin-6-yl-methyl-4-(beta-D-ribofuranosyl)aminobenzene 5'-phosphate synthase